MRPKENEANKIQGEFYNSIEALKEDGAWLMQVCSLPHFSNFQLSKYEYDALEKQLLTHSSASNKVTVVYYEKIFDAFSLIKPKWTTSINAEMLPSLALIPGEGACIVLEELPNGQYKCDSRKGVRYHKLDGAVLYTPIREKRKAKASKSAYEMFRKVALKEKPRIVHAAIATFSINFLALGTSFFSMQVYDRVIPTHGMSTLMWLVVGVFIAILLEMILKVARSVILDHASVKIDKSYSHNIFDRFLKIRLDAMPQSIGTLSAQLQSYATIRSFVSTAALYFIIDLPFTLFFLAIIMMIGGLYMGLVPMIFFLLSLLMAFFFKKKIEFLTMQSVAASNKKLGLLVEAVESVETVKSSGHGYAVLNKWSALSEDAIYDDIGIRHYSELSGYIAAFFQQLSYVGLVALGAYIVSTTDTLTMGGLIAISILSGRVLSPLAMLPNIFIQWGRAKISLKDIDNIYALPNDNEGIERPLFPEIHAPVYTCNNVKFNYGEDMATVAISNLTIKPGEKIAILGVIGSGKSTLLKLLAGLYAPTEGKILLNNIDIQQIARDKLSETIGYLSQNTRLISGTLRDNLVMGLVGVDDMQIMEAAKRTGLNMLINSLPKGLDTIVPEGGNSVSGGQKQLIVITRMLLTNPKIWLLDEPTANMDDMTEKRIIHILGSNISKEQTLVVVTHKPALLKLVDRIIIMTPQGIVMDGARDEIPGRLANAQQQAAAHSSAKTATANTPPASNQQEKSNA
ncbi:MAG: ATP-binding cassette domain-containing protein [Sulfurimonas sp.]|uniref:ATP-binding cassette domain-containing protein n=1 Tax=Sulfurimonas sp. TaxID=2022749 RepID=UPI00263946C8|nr:ATP-binding cassette domain-containing protein [Sulfurimonas sp.]MDD2653029.1 ATP-binding cassette domain-containing protein [Sulfurimonas sp.]MDD3452278.1 ATP-binding cassette domain-containing protein [Sulfurimonas sp.]